MKKQDIFNLWKKLDIKQDIIIKILQKITGLNKSQLFLLEEIDDKYLQILEDYFSRFISWEPIEYILGNAEFYSLDFFVDSRVLVPRNDTEIMVQEAINEMQTWENILIDVWTWSSCIAISILKNTKNIINSFVLDISEKALEVSKINIEKYDLQDKIKQINSDLLEYFNPHLISPKGREIENIIITANLPYIKNRDFENMDLETIIFEPDLALYWWEQTGFELYEKLIFQVLELQLNYNLVKIILLIEIWFDQKDIASDFLNQNNLKFEIYKDNSQIDRCIKIFF